MSILTIRKGTPNDIQAAFDLIKELAIYEKAAHEVATSPESMLQDGFGEQPLFQFYVAEQEEKIIGLALYYFRYSTWKGKSLYLEDLVIQQDHRSKGIGKLLMEALKKEAKRTNCARMNWEVLNWNDPAIQFYKKMNATLDDEWIKCFFVEEQIQEASF